LAISLAMLIPSPAAAAPTPAASCTWKRHSKVIKRVRHQHRVKRVKRWWTCEAQPSLFQPQPALPATPTPAAPPGEEPESEIGHLGVKAVEYSYTLSRPEVSAGEVIVELNNQGEDPHNLVLEHEGSADPSLEIPATPSISQASAHFTLSPGTYRLYCSLYSHEAKGMQATLVVSGD
jgi:plastocyanin